MINSYGIILEKPDPINRLVMSSRSTNCPDRVLQIAPVAKVYPIVFYLKGAGRRWLGVNRVETTICETI